MTGSPWFVPLAGRDGVPLFAFPHAGGGCSQFAGLAGALRPRGVALWAANLPGRQSRLAEAPRTDLAALADEIADELADFPTQAPAGRYTLLGYCGGAVLALAVTRALHARGAPLPRRLVVLSHDAPDIAERPWQLPRLPSAVLWRFLAADGGVTPDLAADPRLRRVAEAAVRADFAMLAGHRAATGAPLPVPILVCHGRADDVRRGALLGWRRQSTHPVLLRSVAGGHWLLDGPLDELAELTAAAATGVGS